MIFKTIFENKWGAYFSGVFITLVIVLSTTGIVIKRSGATSIPVPSGSNPAVEGSTDRAIPTLPPNMNLATPSPESKSITSAQHIGVLLLGYGGAGHEGGFLSDVILVAYFDIQNKKLALIHIPRDIWVSIPTNTTPIETKINAALAMGTKSGNYPIKDLPKDAILRGSYLSKMAVKQVTGLDIDFVIGIDFGNFNKAVDSISGVDVNVNPGFEDPWYPITGRELELCGFTPDDVTAMSATMSGFNLEKQFSCRYEDLKFPAGVTHMNGETALKFVRSRHSSSDFARGDRQISLLTGIRDKLFSLGVLDKIPAFYKSVTSLLKTDITVDNVTEFAPVLKNIMQFKTINIGLSTSNVLQSSSSKVGGSILIPQAGNENWKDINTYIQSQINQ